MFQICTKCDDSMNETHVRPFYRFSFQIEDEEGERLNVSAGNPGVRLRKVSIQVGTLVRMPRPGWEAAERVLEHEELPELVIGVWEQR